MKSIVAAWRGFAVHARDIIQGRSHDWAALRRLRTTALACPPIRYGGADDANPCQGLADLAELIARAGDYHAHFNEINTVSREVLKRCEMAEVGLDILAGMLEQARAA